MKRLVQKEKEKIKELYLSGLSQQSVGDLIGKERSVVAWWTRKFGIVRNLSDAHKGQHSSPATQFKKGHKTWNKGKPHLKKEKNPAWKGGVTWEHNYVRNVDEYKEWRTNVYKRDRYTCQMCKSPSHKNIVAHHVELFSERKDLWFDVDNGITLCRSCHCFHHQKKAA